MLPPPAERCPRSTLYALLALDVVLDASGAPWLVEVNSHPAMGDGTMAAVRPAVYTGLVADVVALLVDGADAAGTGFEPIALPPTPSFLARVPTPIVTAIYIALDQLFIS